VKGLKSKDLLMWKTSRINQRGTCMDCSQPCVLIPQIH